MSGKDKMDKKEGQVQLGKPLCLKSRLPALDWRGPKKNSLSSVFETVLSKTVVSLYPKDSTPT